MILNKIKHSIYNYDIKTKLWEIIYNILSKVSWIISISKIEINWLENISKGKNFLVVSNHPSYIDWKLLDDIFNSIKSNLPLICHWRFFTIPLISDYIKEKWYLWVYRHKSIKSYLKKGFTENESKIKAKKRNNKANKLNIKSIKESIENLLEWKNIGIFITWWWHKDKPSTIHNWYKLIISKTLKSVDEVLILPVKIEYKWWYKYKWLVIRAKVKIDFLEPITVVKSNKDYSFSKIDNIYS